jgi:hypothetical protein
LLRAGGAHIFLFCSNGPCLPQNNQACSQHYSGPRRVRSCAGHTLHAYGEAHESAAESPRLRYCRYARLTTIKHSDTPRNALWDDTSCSRYTHAQTYPITGPASDSVEYSRGVTTLIAIPMRACPSMPGISAVDTATPNIRQLEKIPARLVLPQHKLASPNASSYVKIISAPQRLTGAITRNAGVASAP